MSKRNVTAEHVGKRVRVRLLCLGDTPAVTGRLEGFSLRGKELGADIEGDDGRRHWFRLPSCELLEVLSG